MSTSNGATTAAISDNLCSVCSTNIFGPNSLLFNIHRRGDSTLGVLVDEGSLHETYDSLQVAVTGNCYLCSRLHQRLGPRVRALLETWTPDDPYYGVHYPLIRWITEPLSEDIDARNESHAFELQWILHPQVREVFDGYYPKGLVMCATLYPVDHPTPVPGIPATKVPAGTTGDDISWTDARRWLQACCDDHSGCRSTEPGQIAGEPWYPSRLIDVSASDDPGHARLIETKGTPPIGPYLTLSHCWGTTGSIPKTTRGNIDEFKQRLPELTPKFEDAITATRRLNVRYLWIDSLCIIQDEPDLADWAIESAQMCNVYQNALCNLAATASADGSSGLFSARPELGPCEVKLSDRNFYLVHDYLFSWEVDESPLLARGWVFQERILARRVLHFGSNRLLWECNSLSASQGHPSGLPPAFENWSARAHILSHIQELQSTNFRRQKNSNRHSDNQARLPAADLWHAIVEHYSGTNLTKYRDKLPALSGIVKYLIATIIPGVYHAGIWVQDARTYIGLAWNYTISPKDSNSRHPGYTAPTWSWACTDRGVEFDVLETLPVEPLLKVVEIWTTPSTADPTGAVSYGHLLVRGLVSKFVMYRHKHDGYRGSKPVFKIGDVEVRPQIRDFDVSLDEIYEDDAWEVNAALLLLHMQCEYDDEKATSCRLTFLILREEQPPGTYTRVGLGHTSDLEHVEMLLRGRPRRSLKVDDYLKAGDAEEIKII